MSRLAGFRLSSLGSSTGIKPKRHDSYADDFLATTESVVRFRNLTMLWLLLISVLADVTEHNDCNDTMKREIREEQCRSSPGYL